MAFEAYGLLVLGHVLFASLWFGAGVYQVLVIGRGFRLGGPAAGGFIVTLMKNGGIGRFFAIAGSLAIVFGAVLYGQRMSDDTLETFEGAGLWITLGAIVAVLAFLHGLLVNMPTERKLMELCKGINGPPTKEQAAQLQGYGQKLGKAGVHGVVLVSLAMVLMLLGRVFV